MNTLSYPFLVLLLIFGLTSYAQNGINGSFEYLDNKGNPLGWDLTTKAHQYKLSLDSTVKLHGKYALAITATDGGNYGETGFQINKRYTGKLLSLTGFIKTENVTDGFASLWIRSKDISGKSIAYENMESQGLKGTHDWREFMVQLPYDAQEVKTIHVGAFLVGKGKLWIDNLRLYVDEVPVEKKSESQLAIYPALTDTIFNKNSGITTIPLNKANLRYLALLGELWGFMKYHHPAITSGNYNWDAELFRVLPELIKCSQDVQANQIMEKWVDKLGTVPAGNNAEVLPSAALIAVQPDYGNLFRNKVFSKSLSEKINYILKNSHPKSPYYVAEIDLRDGSKSSFSHDIIYPVKRYPDAGERLLALYRYWSAIQYYSPNRKLTLQDWSTILPAFIPQVIEAGNEHAYIQVMVALITKIGDTHAFIDNKVFENDLGPYRLPFQATFVGDQLIVTSQLRNNEKGKLQRGDIITTINGEKVSALISKYLGLTPASNRAAALRVMRTMYLLRGKDSTFQLKVVRDKVVLKVQHEAQRNGRIDSSYINITKPAYKLLNPDVGYISCSTYQNNQLDSIKTSFRQTKGIIIDMRDYPIDDMIKSLAAYFKPDTTAFAKFSNRSISHPGRFTFEPVTKNGIRSSDYYKGKVIILVNENTQSNAELVTMALQSAPGVKVIGSQSAGADGNTTTIFLPGGIATRFSGIGIYYPDGTNAQQGGVKIDKLVKPSIKDIKEGRDTVLEEAKRMIIIGKF